MKHSRNFGFDLEDSRFTGGSWLAGWFIANFIFTNDCFINIYFGHVFNVCHSVTVHLWNAVLENFSSVG